jgi:ABC-2 type transport system ATP-binding protein
MAREDGVTVFLCSHILADVTRLARRIGIIHQGTLLQELDVDELERNRKRRLVVRVRDGAAARAALAAEGFTVRDASGGALAIDAAAALDRPEDISTRLVQAGCPPIELKIEEEDLEGYFLRLVGMGGESLP